MRLRLSETNLSRDERELWHFLTDFLPHGGLVKLRQLLQLGLGELVGIGGDRFLFDTLPIQIFRQKPLQDLPLRSELRILLQLGINDLFGNLRQALIDLHHDEQVLSSLAMALGISQSDDRGEPRASVIKQELSSILMTPSSSGYVYHMQEEHIQGEEVCFIQLDSP